ncbi:MAG: T9SS type A sorting domain-containing protein, partial [Nonlabens ulvanivorans]
QVLLQDDGKVIVVGMATDATTRRTMLVRFKDVYTLSSRESFSKTYSVYPNPFLDQVNVEGKVEIGQLTLYNTLGQPVSSILNSNVINTSKLPSGIYFLTIIDVQDSKTVRQLIKE